MRDVIHYETETGKRPVEEWLRSLSPVAFAKVSTLTAKLELGLGSVEPLGDGVSEQRDLSKGPGYRLYFGTIDNKTVLLCAGGDKSSQNRDIKEAKKRWKDYKSRMGKNA